MHIAKRKRHRVVDGGFRQAIHPTADIHRLPRQCGLAQRVDTVAVRLQAQRHRAALGARCRGIDTDHQRAVVAAAGRQLHNRTGTGGVTRGRTQHRVQRLGETVGHRGVADRQRLLRDIAHMHITQYHRRRRVRTGLGQPVDIAADVHGLVRQRHIGNNTAGAGAVRLGADSRRAALGARSTGVDADHQAAVVRRLRRQQVE